MRLHPAPAALVAGLLLMGLTATPAAADVMRCGSQLVHDGDGRDKVEKLCGQPTEIENRSVLRRPSFVRNGRVVYFGEARVEVPVEIWTYNLGPSKLMRRIRFVDGVIEEIETLGYGYNETR